jgi:hypothetical protein
MRVRGFRSGLDRIERRLLVAIIVFACVVLALGALDPALATSRSDSAGPGAVIQAPSRGAASRPAEAILPGVPHLERTYRGVSDVYQLASTGKYALLALLHPNDISSLVLVNAATNSSKVVEKRDPGGDQTFPASMVGAGGAFFMEWANGTTFQTSWQEIFTNGSVRNVTLPVATSVEWVIVYGNASAFVVGAGPTLMAIDPTTLTVAANYSTAIPRDVSDINGFLPDGSRIYLSGAVLDRRTDVYRAFFGFLNLSSGRVTTVAVSGGASDASISNWFDVLVADGKEIYVGGETDSENASSYRVVHGLFYRYDPSTSDFENLSRLLPAPSWGVYGLDPWGDTIGVSMNSFAVNLSTGQTEQNVGGVYALVHGASLRLVNVTADLASGYVPAESYVTAASAGWFFSGGTNTHTGLAQFVAIRP